MKTKKIFSLAALAIMLFAACQKENDIAPSINNNDTTPAATERRATYLGTYDMTYVTDSVGTDGQWFQNGFAGQDYPDEYGYMVISADPADTAAVKIDGYLVYTDDVSGDSDTILMYDTRATFGNDNHLQPESSVLETMGMTFTNTYGHIIRIENGGIRFRIEQHLPYYDMDFGYIITANGSKRAE